MSDTYSFNDILRANFQECSLLFEHLFINTENNNILGYLCGKYPNDIRNGGCIKFISPCGTRIRKICGNNFIKNAKILKILKE